MGVTWLGPLPAAVGAVALLCVWVADIGLGQAQSPDELEPVRGKKLIAFGWDSPNTLYLKEHLDVFEASGYQGIVVNVCHEDRLPNRTDFRHGDEWFRLADKVFIPQRLKLQDWQYVVEDLKACRFENLTDNFLLVHAIPAQVDFFDEDFEAAVHNIRAIAELARRAGAKGLFVDVENYSGRSLFRYPDRPHAGEKSFAEYAARARERGREFAGAACEAYPEITFLFVWCHSSSAHYMAGGTALESTGYGLLPAFVDGMLEGKMEEARIVDGFEFAYPYRSKPDFLSAYHTIRHTARRLSTVPRLYDAGIEAGFGIWLDHRSKPWSTEDFSQNFHTPESFRQAARAALEVSDRYVWVWAERAARWYGTSYPDAYRQATRMATSPPASVRGAPEGARPVVELPLEWRFRTDPDDGGLARGYHAADLDDSGWQMLKIDQAWEKQGVEHDGVAWYRVGFSVESLPQEASLYVQFGAVDESAWVYLNGQFVGEHDIGEAGWDKPFAIDVTKTIHPGTNLLAVRVLDRVLAGGIWKPVELVAAP